MILAWLTASLPASLQATVANSHVGITQLWMALDNTEE